MATYYVDPNATGQNNGTSWSDAWTSIQSAFNTATAGDMVYCRGTQVLSGTLNINVKSGNNTAGFIRYIGCNANGEVDGTRFNINGNGGAYNVITWGNGYPMYWFENFRFYNTGAGNYDGIRTIGGASALGSVFINCSFDNCGRHGWYGFSYATKVTFYRCVFRNNGSHGAYGCDNFYYFCAFRDNGGHGASFYMNFFYGCIFSGNAADGLDGVDYRTILINCVVDGNANYGIDVESYTINQPVFLLGIRITNHSGAGDIGLNANSEPVITGHCYFEDNTTNIANASLHYVLPLEGSSSASDMADQSNTDEGYVDRANKNFATRYVNANDPSIRRRAITIPWS